MIVSPKAAAEAGDKFGLKPVCAGPFKFVERVQQDRIVVEKFPQYWNAANVHIDRVVFRPIAESTVRLANLKSGSLDLIERALATDLKEIKADPKLKLATQIEIGYQGLTLNLGERRGRQERPLRQGPAGAPGAGSGDRPQGALRCRLQRRGAARQPVGQSQEPLLPAAVPGSGPRCRQGQEAACGRGHGNTRQRRLHGAEQSRKPAGRRGDPGHGRGSRAST